MHLYWGKGSVISDWNCATSAQRGRDYNSRAEQNRLKRGRPWGKGSSHAGNTSRLRCCVCGSPNQTKHQWRQPMHRRTITRHRCREQAVWVASARAVPGMCSRAPRRPRIRARMMRATWRYYRYFRQDPAKHIPTFTPSVSLARGSGNCNRIPHN